MKSRVCIECRELKALRAFHKKRTGKYGVSPKCKVCTKEYSQRRWIEKGEELKAKQNARNATPETKSARSIYNRKRYDDPDFLLRQREYNKKYENRPEVKAKISARKKAKYQKDKDSAPERSE